ncbi:MAG TPA: redoxin domain-containing protein [Thermoplasmata archaeon]|nr:redoxin domain-containing protein [Thermoplasmata archaeon]
MAVRRGACVLGMLLAVTLFLAVPSARAADPAPAFDLTDIDGVPLNSTGLLGHVVIFDFGGTWCEPCKIVEAAFKEEFATFEARGVVFITTFIAPLNAPSDIRTYQTGHAIPWHLVQDNGVSTTYGIVQIPHFFVIDKKGYAVLDWSPVPGFTSADVKRALEPVLTAALAIGPAPPWTLTDIDGRNVSSGQFRGQIVVLDFANTSCGTCATVEAAFRDLNTTYGARGVVFLTVFLAPANSPAEIAAYRTSHQIDWPVATDDGIVSANYSVSSSPRFFVIDRDAYVIFDWAYYANFTQAEVKQATQGALDRALQGNVGGISIIALSIPALLVVAALLSFFSPCSFPVLPAFMTFYMNLDAKGETDPAKKPTAKTAAGRGFIASLGIVAVYGIIALIVFAAGVAAKAILPWVSPVVGVLLIVFGILTLLPYQYHFLTRPFIALKKKIAARFGGNWTPGIKTKLFAFGAGYGAAGFACVAPPFIGAVLNASALGRADQALFGLALYVLIVIVTMIAVVVALHVAGDRALKKIRVWSSVIKYVSAAALLVAGGYLLWLFSTTYR